jgi:hypothetical protein
VVDNRNELQETLAGSPLQDFIFDETPILDTGTVGFETQVPVADRHVLWRAARTLLPRTGRWPVVVFDGGTNVYHRERYSHGEGEQAQPVAIVARAQNMTVEEALKTRRQGVHDKYYREDWDRIVGIGLDETARRVGDAAPTRKQVAQHVGPPDLTGLERFLFEWEERVRPTIGREPWVEFEPWSDVEDVLVLLPTPHGWETPAYSDYTMCSRGWERGHHALIVALHHWHRRYGAELVISGGDWLQLDVARPPADVREAFALAQELRLFAGLPDGSLRLHARDLIDRTTWFLQERF